MPIESMFIESTTFVLIFFLLLLLFILEVVWLKRAIFSVFLLLTKFLHERR